MMTGFSERKGAMHLGPNMTAMASALTTPTPMPAVTSPARKDGFGQLSAFPRGEEPRDDGHGPHGQCIGNHDKDEIELDDKTVGGLNFFSHLASYIHVGQADQGFKEHDEGHRPAGRKSLWQIFYCSYLLIKSKN